MNSYVNPVTFWGMFLIALVCISLMLGTFLRDIFDAWYVPWRAKRLARVQATPPSTLRAVIKKQKRVIAILRAQNMHLENTIKAMKGELKLVSRAAGQLQDEKRRLSKRNNYMANELRWDPLAETQVLPE